MCSIIAHDKKQPLYEDKENSIGDIPIPKNATTEALEALGATINFIDCCIKLFEFNYVVICVMYEKAMKNMFQNIPTVPSKPFSSGA